VEKWKKEGDMQTLQVRLETVTPLFLGGADPRGSPEIRVPSIRGALRYWLRAALGPLAHDDLKRAEARVFGDTSQASAVIIRARSDAQPFHYFETRDVPDSRNPEQMRKEYVHREVRATAYLFFSLTESKRGAKDARRCYPSGEEIELELLNRGRDALAWERACGALWLWLRLGGLGARSRRGAGALQPLVLQEEPEEWPPTLPGLTMQAESAMELATSLRADLTRLRQVLGAGNPVSPPTEYDTLAPNACQIWVLNPDPPWRSWTAALRAVEAALKHGRAPSPPGQIDEVREALKHDSNLPDIGRAALGLPIVYHDVQTGKDVGTLQASVGEQDIQRRASPLHIRVVKLGGEMPAYTVVLTWFNARFAPTGAKLALRDTTVTGALPDPTWMGTHFWPRFDEKSQTQRLEVRFQ
jgi:CRISPR-associated protein Cmr1